MLPDLIKPSVTRPALNAAFGLRPLRLDEDVTIIQPWYQMDYAYFWSMQDMSVEATADFYREAAQRGLHAYLGFEAASPAFVLECYDPRRDPLGDCYAVQPGDVGMHFFVGPAARPIRHYTRDVLRTVMAFLFDNLGARRVVVEPDARNERVHRLNRLVGFVDAGTVALPGKTARLAFCTANDFAHSLKEFPMTMSPGVDKPASAVSHLNPEVWRKVNRLLVRKAIAEFAHEQVFAPTRLDTAARNGWGIYELVADTANCRYRFEARRMALRHWHVDAASIERQVDGVPQSLDALTFFIDFKRSLGIPSDKLPVYLDEISSTLYGAAYKHGRQALSSAALADADYQTLEAAMIEGHPGFVANNGRLGFDALDYHAYAPETGALFAIVWLAVHRDNAHFAAVPELDHAMLLRQELGERQLIEFRQQLTACGADPAHYIFMPTHPWQWNNKLSIMFAADIAERRIVPLGLSDDQYCAQQSVRTFFNVSHPQRCYVKTSLSVLNMGFMRGLSPYYMAGTPAINDYLHRLISADPVLRDLGFGILREVASVGYRNRYYEAALATDSPYKKMLSALWRESPMPRLQRGERLMTMAALLHVDPDGTPLLPELIRRSGLTAAAWLRRYLEGFLVPVVHCFYAHHLVFMPHGENLILVLEGHVPTRVFMKDIAEESAILDKDAKMPAGLERLAVDVPEDFKILGIFIDISDGVFRHMSQLLDDSGCLPEDAFWRTVAESVLDYQRAHPELAERFARYDFFAPTFLHSCLNRLQLKNNLQMVDLANPAGSLIMADPLENPVAPFGPTAARHAAISEAALPA